MSPLEAAKTKLLQLIRQKSYRTGDFTLASGKKSSFFVDLKNTTLHPEGAACIGDLVIRKVMDEELEIEGIGGLTLGADPIAMAVTLKALEKGKYWPAFIVRKEMKDHGAIKSIEGSANLKPGARVLVLEDVVTTGASGLTAVKRLREAGFKPVAVLTVIDREEGGREAFEREGLKLYALATLREVQNS